MEQRVVPLDAQKVLNALNESYTNYHQTCDETVQLAEEKSFYLCWQWLVDQQVQFYQDLSSQEWKLGTPPLREVVL